uniref:Uncharacterized protein n=1 Tax=Arundo donax TaxID=35708 RepID=A0A0A9BTM3_ARUDO
MTSPTSTARRSSLIPAFFHAAGGQAPPRPRHFPPCSDPQDPAASSASSRWCS